MKGHRGHCKYLQEWTGFVGCQMVCRGLRLACLDLGLETIVEFYRLAFALWHSRFVKWAQRCTHPPDERGSIKTTVLLKGLSWLSCSFGEG